MNKLDLKYELPIWNSNILYISAYHLYLAEKVGHCDPSNEELYEQILLAKTTEKLEELDAQIVENNKWKRLKVQAEIFTILSKVQQYPELKDLLMQTNVKGALKKAKKVLTIAESRVKGEKEEENEIKI